MDVLKKLRHDRRHHPAHYPRVHLQYRHNQSLLDRHRCRLQSDVATANDGESSTGDEVFANAIHVLNRSQIKNPGRSTPGTGKVLTWNP